MKLGGILKEHLLAAVQEHQFAGAVDVCRQIAPTVARELSRTEGVVVRRISSKTRNPVNRPSDWEAEGLAVLERMLADGVEPAAAEWSSTAENGEGERELRYLKAIVTEPLCLTCHGEVREPDLVQTLRALYPRDEATGYRAGQLRGAFSVLIPLVPAP